MNQYKPIFREIFEYMEKHIRNRNLLAATKDINLLAKKYDSNKFIIDMLAVVLSELARSGTFQSSENI